MSLKCSREIAKVIN